jgi:hypothetical protein
MALRAQSSNKGAHHRQFSAFLNARSSVVLMSSILLLPPASVYIAARLLGICVIPEARTKPDSGRDAFA